MPIPSPRSSFLGHALIACVLVCSALSVRPAEAMPFTQAEVDAALKAKDYKKLTNFCLDNDDLDDAWRSACHAVLADHEARGDAAFLLAICNNQKKAWHTEFYRPACEAGKRVAGGAYKKELASCATVKTVYDKYENDLKPDARDDLYFAVGVRAAECKEWEYLWTELVHHGGRGLVLLRKIAEAGIAVEVELIAYLDAHKTAPFAFEHGSFATSHALTWVREANKVGKCTRFLPYAKAANEDNLGTWLEFFAETECKPAASLAVGRLRSKKPSQRRQACAVLGLIGSKKDVAKLQILAKTDPEYKLERIRGAAVKTYWVREACTAAIGSIKLQ